jgi:predicted anti-sigma-YlaC factor YlaD
MSNCKEIRNKLSAYIDNELPPLEQSLIERHIHQCPACAQEEKSLRKISELLDSIPDESPAPVFTSIAVHRAAAWKRCAYIKEYLYRYAVAFVSLIFMSEYEASIKRRYPVYRYLRNFDDFPPESLSGIYITFIQGEYR